MTQYKSFTKAWSWNLTQRLSVTNLTHFQSVTTKSILGNINPKYVTLNGQYVKQQKEKTTTAIEQAIITKRSWLRAILVVMLYFIRQRNRRGFLLWTSRYEQCTAVLVLEFIGFVIQLNRDKRPVRSCNDDGWRDCRWLHHHWDN